MNFLDFGTPGFQDAAYYAQPLRFFETVRAEKKIELADWHSGSTLRPLTGADFTSTEDEQSNETRTFSLHDIHWNFSFERLGKHRLPVECRPRQPGQSPEQPR